MVMRLLAVSMLLILAEASAAACPAGTACVAAETRSSSSKERERVVAVAGEAEGAGGIDRANHARAGREELARQSARPVQDHSATLLGHPLARIDLRTGGDLLTHSLRTHVAPRQRADQMPGMWRSLRSGVYAKMPTYESHGRPENRISLTLAPVVVDSPSDTVPGLGIEGAF